MADDTAGLRVIDVSNPYKPHEVGYYNTPGRAWGVYLTGGYAYVADGGGGLRVIDVSNPANPHEVGYYDTPGYAWGVYLTGGYAYVADGGAGLRVIDVSNPSNPHEVGYYDTPGYAYGVYVTGGYAYVADEWAGLQIHQFYGVWVEEDGAHPVTNPLKIKVNSVSRFDISLEVKRGARAELKLYDVAGRRVWKGSYNAGRHHVSISLPTGTYFIYSKVRYFNRVATYTKRLIISN